MNKLISEKSPYLLQHAHNPVDWYPWGPEALEKAKKEDKPILLSVGYATCHWCHVMEDESYTDLKIAAILNASFVAIKVDREERPDIDGAYMRVLQGMTGSGGWPMHIFLTADLKPFYAGTYFSPDVFINTLKHIAAQEPHERDALSISIELLDPAIEIKTQKNTVGDIFNEGTLKNAYQRLHSYFDPQYGGFGFAPKFPQAHLLSFLLRYHQRTHEPSALMMVEKTLERMASGGVYDQMAGGFHRYSTDERWFMPHFEKMLYDQAMLARAYLQAYQVTGKKFYALIAREVLDFVLAAMTSEEGYFYTALDADTFDLVSHKRTEGMYYLWEKNEILDVLGKEKGSIVSFYYGLEEYGNSADFLRKNILTVCHSSQETADHFKTTVGEIENVLNVSKQTLITLRQQRPRPQTDDKMLTDLNGLMMASFALGAKVLDEPRYLETAKKCADFLLRTVKTVDGALKHRYRDKEVLIDGFLDDYAFLSYGLFELYQVSLDPYYLNQSKQIAQKMIDLFADTQNGGFYFTSDKNSSNSLRPYKEFNDNAIPSGNAIAALVLFQLGRATSDIVAEAASRAAVQAACARIAENPSACAQMLEVLEGFLQLSSKTCSKDGCVF